MVEDEFLQVRFAAGIHEPFLVEEKVVTDTASDIGVTYALHFPHPLIEFEKTGVVPVHV